ncbi:MAG: 50S ribosomal protein L24 [Proteobacteria bacterium]|nr:50S ribosomal protein L24 [Pseudomonadota bacterium]
MRKGAKLPRPAKSLGKTTKSRLKVGDKVVVIAGNSKGKTGVIKSLDLVKSRVLVDGINVKVKHKKAGKDERTGLTYESSPVAISNVAYYDDVKKKATRIGYKVNAASSNVAEKKQRFLKASERVIQSNYVRAQKKST